MFGHRHTSEVTRGTERLIDDYRVTWSLPSRQLLKGLLLSVLTFGNSWTRRLWSGQKYNLVTAQKISSAGENQRWHQVTAVAVTFPTLFNGSLASATERWRPAAVLLDSLWCFNFFVLWLAHCVTDGWHCHSNYTWDEPPPERERSERARAAQKLAGVIFHCTQPTGDDAPLSPPFSDWTHDCQNISMSSSLYFSRGLMFTRCPVSLFVLPDICFISLFPCISALSSRSRGKSLLVQDQGFLPLPHHDKSL